MLRLSQSKLNHYASEPCDLDSITIDNLHYIKYTNSCSTLNRNGLWSLAQILVWLRGNQYEMWISFKIPLISMVSVFVYRLQCKSSFLRQWLVTSRNIPVVMIPSDTRKSVPDCNGHILRTMISYFQDVWLVSGHQSYHLIGQCWHLA